MIIEKIRINEDRVIDFENITLIKSGNSNGKTFLFDLLYLVTGANYSPEYMRKGIHTVNEVEVIYTNGEKFLIRGKEYFYDSKGKWVPSSQKSITQCINKDFIGKNNLFVDDSLTYRFYNFLNFLPEIGYGDLSDPFPYIKKLEKKMRKKIRISESMDLLLKKFDIDDIEQNTNSKKIKNAKKFTAKKIKTLEDKQKQISVKYTDLEKQYFNNAILIDELSNENRVEKNLKALEDLSKSSFIPLEIKRGLSKIIERETRNKKLELETKILISNLKEKNEEISSMINLNVFERKIEQRYIQEEINAEQRKIELLEDVNEVESSLDIKEQIEEKVKKYVLKYDNGDLIRTFLSWMTFDEANYELKFDNGSGVNNTDIGGKATKTVFNTALLLSLHEYLIEKNLPHLRFLVMDTPSQPFEETDDQENFSKFINMIKSYSNQHNNTQIVIIEKSGMCERLDNKGIKVIDMKRGLIK